MVVWRARATMGCRSEPTRRPTPATGTDRHNSSNSDYVSVLLLLFGPVPLSLPRFRFLEAILCIQEQRVVAND